MKKKEASVLFCELLFPAETSKKIFQPPTIFSENGRKLVDQNTLESHGKLG